MQTLTNEKEIERGRAPAAAPPYLLPLVTER